MKKLLLITAMAVMSFAWTNAQIMNEKGEISGNDASGGSSQPVTNSSSTSYPRGAVFNTRFDENLFGMDIGFDMGEMWHLNLGMDVSSFKISGARVETNLYSIGFGWSKRAVLGDWFLLQGRIYPYMGWGSHNTNYFSSKTKDEEKTEFTYGARADAQIGFRIIKQKDGTQWFLTGGYTISSPEFETKDMFDNGVWGIGITIIN